MTRASVDTNHLLRMAAGGDRARLWQLWRDERFSLIMSLATLTELRTVLARPEIQNYVPAVVGVAFLQLVEQRAAFVQPDLTAPICCDPQDSALIATAVGGQAAYLVTADPDLLDDPVLLAVLQARGLQVVTARVFVEQLDAPSFGA